MAFVLLTTYIRRSRTPPETLLIRHPTVKTATRRRLRCSLLSPQLGACAIAPPTGKKLAFDRGKGNCLTCHAIKGGDLPGTIGPELKDIKTKYPTATSSSRSSADETKRNPQTVMPPFGRNRILTEQEINAIVDFLQTL